MRDRADHREIVADEEIAHAQALLQADEQRQDLALNRRIERARRLIQQQEFGLQSPPRGRWRCAGAGRPKIRAGSGSACSASSPTSSSAAMTRPRRAAASSSRKMQFESFADDLLDGPAAATARRTGPGIPPACACADGRSARCGRPSSRVPSNEMTPVARCSRSTARPSVVLPEPDSPTMPRVSPRFNVEARIAHGVEVVMPEPAALDRIHAIELVDSRAVWPGCPRAARPCAVAGSRAAGACTRAAAR